MKSGKLNKMATTLAVLFLVMSGLMVVQWNAQPVEATQHEDYTYTIEGFIEPLEAGVTIESDLEIKLRSLSTGEIEDGYTSEDFYEFTNVKPGWYEIIFPSQIEDDIAYMRYTTEPFEISDEDVIEDFEVSTREIDRFMEVNVTYGNEPIDNLEKVTVTLEDRNLGFTHEASLVDEENATFKANIYSDFDGSLMVEKEGFAPYFNTSIELDNDTTFKEVELSKTPLVEGRLVDEEGRAIREEMDITLYSEEVGVLHRTKGGPTFRIRGPVGYDYTLVVDAPGYEPLVNDSISFDEDEDVIRLGRSEVKESEPEEFHSNLEFDYDEETKEDDLTVTSTRSIRAGTRMETFDYPYVGNLAMQIDIALGDGDGHLGEAEVEEFKRRLNYTKEIAYTPQFITVNDTVYELTNYTAEFSEGFEENLTGDVTDLFEGEIYFNTTREYTLVEEIGPGKHVIDMTVEHDRMYGNKRNYTYEIELRDGYERYLGEDTEQYIPENVEVEGFTELKIDPQEVHLYEDFRSRITLDIRESDPGELEIILERQPWRYEKEEDYYVIRYDTELQLTAEYRDRDDFVWFLDDEEIGEGREITHLFNETGELELTAETTDGRVSGSVMVFVDDEGPHGPHIVVNDENITLGEGTSVNETEEVEFSGRYFEDDETGEVDRYQWNFSDGSEIQEGENVTHIFDVPGEYDVSLNVTDAVGNWNDDNTISVKVMDITEPEGDFSIEWNDNSTYEQTVRLEKEINVTFNGTEIVAHPEEYEGSALTFNWTLIDEDANETLELVKVEEEIRNYTFTEAGEYTIRLNVSDEGEFSEGNYREIEKTVIIERGPVPDLMVHDLVFSKEDVRVGDTVTISVNVTNIGDLTAEDIDTRLTVNGEPVSIEDIRFYKDGEELNETEIAQGIAQGETVTIRFEWEPEEDGENTVNVNVTDGGEPEDLWLDNEAEETIMVDPPAWRQYVVYALIPIIIIGVVVGLYLYKDRLTEMLR